MPGFARTAVRLTDSPIIHRVKWEVGLLYGRRRYAWIILLSLAGTGLFAGVHFTLMLPPNLRDQLSRSPWLRILLMSTPIANAVPNLGQRMGTGFVLVRAVSLGIVAIAMICLPAIAGGGAACNRQARRHADLALLPTRPISVFFARVAGALAPFVLFTLAMALPCAGVIAAHHGPYLESARLALELISQLLMIAVVSTACSVGIRSVIAARVVAYLLVLVVLPFLWFLLALYSHIAPWSLVTLLDHLSDDALGPSGFVTVAWLQTAFIGITIALASIWGVRGVRADRDRRAGRISGRH